MDESTEMSHFSENQNSNQSTVEMDEEKLPITTNTPNEKVDSRNGYDENDFSINVNTSTMRDNELCCQSIRAIGPLYWYLSPLTCDLGHSIKCLAFQLLQALFVFGVWLFLSIVIPIGVSFIIIACSGLLILYVSYEVTLVLTRLELNMAYYMVEKDEILLNPNNKWKLKLKIDNKELPTCSSTFCVDGMRFERVKFLLTKCQMYWILVYHLLINPFVVLFTSLSVIPVLQLLYVISFPLWYLINDSWFKNGKECFYGNDCNNNGMNCKCHGWQIKDGGDIALIFVVALLLLPLALRFCNFMSLVAKKWIYYALTDYYKIGYNNEISPHKKLLNQNTNDTNTKGLDISEANDNINGQTETNEVMV